MTLYTRLDMVEPMRHFGMTFGNDRSIYYLFKREDIETRFPPMITPNDLTSPRYWDSETTAKIISYFTKAQYITVLEYLNKS